MFLHNIRWIKFFFLTKLDCVAVNVKLWLRLRRSCRVTLEAGRRKWRTWSDLFKMTGNKVLSEDSNSSSVHQLFYSWVGGNHNGLRYSKPLEVCSFHLHWDYVWNIHTFNLLSVFVALCYARARHRHRRLVRPSVCPSHVGILQRQISRKWYKIELYLNWQTGRKSYLIYLMVPLSVTLNDPEPKFQGHDTFIRCWVSQKR